MDDFDYVNAGERRYPMVPLPRWLETSFFTCDPKLEDLRLRLRNEFPSQSDLSFPIFVMLEDLPKDHPEYVKVDRKKRTGGNNC